MRTLPARWEAFWFTPSAPLALGACRIAFFLGLLWFRAGRGRSAFAEVPDVFWMPIPLFAWLGLPVLPSFALAVADRLWVLALVLAALGVATRVSTATAFLLGTYLLGLPHNFGKTNHSDALAVIALGIFALARSGDALALDRLWGRRPVPARSWEYTWPVRLGQAAFALAFLAAGIAKLRHGGLAWVTSDHLSYLLLSHHYSGHQPPFALGLTLAANAWIYRSLALCTVVLELAAPLALVSLRARALVIPGIIGMLLGFHAVLGVPFKLHYPLLAFWVPWEALAAWGRARGRGPLRTADAGTA